MSLSPELIVVGSHAPGFFLRVKRPPVPGETVIGWDYMEPKDGGKGSNQAIAAAKLGAKVSFVGCVGRDRIGDEGRLWMQEAGVDTTYLRQSQSLSSGVGFIMLNEDGVPAMATSMGANAELSQVDVEEAISSMPGARVMLTQFEIPANVALHAAQVGRRYGITTIVNAAPAVELSLSSLQAADILTPNEAEARTLLGLGPNENADAAVMAHQLHEQSGASCVIITVGELGVVAADSGGIWTVKPPKVQVVDTSGAGDAFCAALAVGLVKGRQVREAAQWACMAAALSVTRFGTIPAYPTIDEVSEFLAGQ